jgi:hypothetical protein
MGSEITCKEAKFQILKTYIILFVNKCVQNWESRDNTKWLEYRLKVSKCQKVFHYGSILEKVCQITILYFCY